MVIPTRDRAERAREAVTAVLADPACIEVVVVDDGSTDGTPAVLAALAAADVRVVPVHGGGAGRAAARQLGVEVATGDLVLLLDDDVIALRGLVTGHRARHATGGEELVVVGYMPTAVPARRRAGQSATRLYATEYETHVAAWRDGRAEVLDGLWMGNVSASRRAWLAVRIDDDFPAAHHEDQDLGLRMQALGLQGVFDPALRAEHRHERSVEQFLADSYQQGVGRVAIARRHARHGVAAPAVGSDLPRPLRAALAVTDSPHAGAAARRSLGHVAAVAGRVRAWPVEDGACRLLRRMELRRGARAGALR